jgi:1-phosphofructokinase
MIYTCTITPSIDYTTYLSDFHTGALNRTNEVFYYPGGKGINVSRVLKRLNVDSIALGFVGGFTGTYIEQFLMKEGIDTDFIETDEITRINVKIKAQEETELNGPGPVINTQQQMILINKIRTLKKGDWFVLAGSLPESIPQTFFMEIASICNDQNVHFVLDTSGPPLKELVLTQPFLIKPNEHELGELFDTIIANKHDACHFAKRLVNQGVQHVIVSMGEEGALLVTKDLVVSAEAPKGKIINTVGSGDSLISGFIASFTKNQDAEKAFRYGVASGSATAFRSDLCTKSDVEALEEQVILHPFQEQDVTG